MFTMVATPASQYEACNRRFSLASMCSNTLQRLHVGEARAVAFSLALVIIIYHSVMRLMSGADSCQSLLQDGRFDDSHIWQPGCSMHNYTLQEAHRCMKHPQLFGQKTELVFVGDSRVRFIWWEFLALLGYPRGVDEKFEEDREFANSQMNIRMRFFWRVYLDDAFEKVIRDLQNHNQSTSTPQLIIADNGLHAIKFRSNSEASLLHYRQKLTHVGSMMAELAGEGSQVLWVIQAPLIHSRLGKGERLMTNQKVLDYNAAARQALSGTRVHLWESYRLIGEGLLDEYRDGVHVGPSTDRIVAQMLFNIICNNHMSFSDGACCRTSAFSTQSQRIAVSTLTAVLLTSSVLMMVRWARSRYYTPVQEPAHNRESSFSSLSADLVISLGKLCLIMTYFFLCDRTTLFMKERRFFTLLNFWSPLIFIFLLAICSVKNNRDAKFLHRDQTDEWKGWMQLVILVYHMTYASQELSIYMHVRVLVSSYLFLTGYGHSMQFWNTGVVDFTRFFRVLFRMNILTVVLCLFMNRSYQFYYFVPLISFWYIMLYIMLVAPPRVTAESSKTNRYQYLCLIFKFAILFSVITVLFRSETFFSWIFLSWPWRALFTTDSDDVQQWWFRSRLDRFSTGYGMLFAFLCVLAQRHLNWQSTWTSRISTIAAIILAVAGLGSYTVFALKCHNKSDCNSIHSYLTVVPIVGYIVLRNAVGCLRTHHSHIFAWFGRISLELFIGQYHIWMADDAKNILVLVPHHPLLNLLITSFLFVCASVEINKITNHLASLVVSIHQVGNRFCFGDVVKH